MWRGLVVDLVDTANLLRFWAKDLLVSNWCCFNEAANAALVVFWLFVSDRCRRRSSRFGMISDVQAFSHNPAVVMSKCTTHCSKSAQQT
jgi:hypothetical protein